MQSLGLQSIEGDRCFIEGWLSCLDSQFSCVEQIRGSQAASIAWEIPLQRRFLGVGMEIHSRSGFATLAVFCPGEIV